MARGKKAHHVNASKKGFRGAIGGASPVGVGHTAGVNKNAFGKKGKFNTTQHPRGGGYGRPARRPQTPKGIGPTTAGYGIIDGHGSSNQNLTAKANSIFGTLSSGGSGRGKKPKIMGGGSDAC